MLQHQEEPSNAMVASPDYWARLANYILLYDQIVIPTGNLQIIPVLRIILGEDVFDELVRSKVIVLARFDQWFGYWGNGAGLSFFKVFDGPSRPLNAPNLATTFFKPLEITVDDILRITNPPSSIRRRNEIVRLLMDTVLAVPTERIAASLKEETHKDIMGSPYLRDFLSLRNSGRSLDALAGTGKNTVTVFNPHVPAEAYSVPEIRSLLRVAFENFLLSIGGHAQVTDITGDETTLGVIRGKAQRMGFPTEGDNAFAQIQKLSGVPDIGVAFSHKVITPRQILDLRHSRHAQSLRDWFSAGSPSETADETVRRYIESIGKPSWIESVPVKLFRFLATSSLSAIQPVVGAAASVIDACVLGKWFPSKSPRLFLEQAKVMLANSSGVQPPKTRGRDRNALCSCGSGKKLKKCCGR